MKLQLSQYWHTAVKHWHSKAGERMQTPQMGFLRNMAEYTLKDQIINTVIRDE
jgi:hypothetical protein